MRSMQAMTTAATVGAVRGDGDSDAAKEEEATASATAERPDDKTYFSTTESYFWKGLSKQSKYIWAPEGARKMRELSLSQWLCPICLPMLLVIQPLTDYNLRACAVLLVLAFLVWSQYGPSKAASSSSTATKHGHGNHGHGHHRSASHCEKCELYLHKQRLDLHVKPAAAAASFYWPLGGPASWLRHRIRRLPRRLLSRHWGRLANNASLPRWLNLLLLWLYVKLFKLNLDEAERDRITDYDCLGDLFTRTLKSGARPVAKDSDLVSPADGLITFRGSFQGGFLQQVKGVHYSLNYFLGLSPGQTGGPDRVHAACHDGPGSGLLECRDGSTRLYQWVVYLSPGDYHRFHSPADWTVVKRRHFPGELLSVKPKLVSSLPGLFHVNERVSWLGRWRHGFFSLTAVGATNVGSIHARFDPELRTNQARSLKRDCTMVSGCGKAKRAHYFDEKSFEQDPVRLEKGQSFGHFNFGSTIVLLFEAPAAGFRFEALATGAGEARIRVGRPLARTTESLDPDCTADDR